jgi:hypothetical protein
MKKVIYECEICQGPCNGIGYGVAKSADAKSVSIAFHKDKPQDTHFHVCGKEHALKLVEMELDKLENPPANKP